MNPYIMLSKLDRYKNHIRRDSGHDTSGNVSHAIPIQSGEKYIRDFIIKGRWYKGGVVLYVF